MTFVGGVACKSCMAACCMLGLPCMGPHNRVELCCLFAHSSTGALLVRMLPEVRLSGVVVHVVLQLLRGLRCCFVERCGCCRLMGLVSCWLVVRCRDAPSTAPHAACGWLLLVLHRHTEQLVFAVPELKSTVVFSSVMGGTVEPNMHAPAVTTGALLL